MMNKDNNKHLVGQSILQQILDLVPCQHFCLLQFRIGNGVQVIVIVNVVFIQWIIFPHPIGVFVFYKVGRVCFTVFYCFFLRSGNSLPPSV
jgi:hypothetical protein